jgi:hypothetical protein
MPLNHKDPVKTVCEQAEWEEIEMGRPGVNTLIQGGFATEGAAEKVARGEPVLVPTLWAKRRT